MACFIYARDGISRIVLKRDSKEAAEKKARELKDLGVRCANRGSRYLEGSLFAAIARSERDKEQR
jgi:tRNA(Ser,Leu) C12 N-acetylase TAN1